MKETKAKGGAPIYAQGKYVTSFDKDKIYYSIIDGAIRQVKLIGIFAERTCTYHYGWYVLAAGAGKKKIPVTGCSSVPNSNIYETEGAALAMKNCIACPDIVEIAGHIIDFVPLPHECYYNNNNIWLYKWNKETLSVDPCEVAIYGIGKQCNRHANIEVDVVEGSANVVVTSCERNESSSDFYVSAEKCRQANPIQVIKFS